ncbi:MAG: RNA methyltransferase [Lachnospiraceae bacterium]|nr:RNA methyltransferase [Lachnospiraceae bacterium]MDD3660638.1 RNA methyltransferase [Lachnospiraceae bacterium]
MITSVSNSRIKKIIQIRDKVKIRREEDVFLVEGVRMFLEAPEENILELYLSESFYHHASAECREKIKNTEAGYGVKAEVVADTVFQKMSSTVTPQGILCVIRQLHYSMEDLLKNKAPLLVIVENLQDPGNLGTIFRTAEGAGVDGIIMNRETADLTNPKTIRSTMGSVYRVPFIISEHLEQEVKQLKEKGITVFAAHLSGRDIYEGVSFLEGSAFLIGNEGNGLSEELGNLATEKIKIPMEGKVESLNAAIASSLLVYEARRQRKAGKTE